MSKVSKKTVFTLIGIVIFTVAVLAAISVFGKGKGKGGAGAPGKGGPKGGFGGSRGGGITSVKTIEAENTVLKDYVVTNGEIQTQTAIEVFPSIGGKVVEIAVSLGSPVHKNDLIAYVDPSEPGSYYAKSAVLAPIDGSIISSPVKPGTKVTTSSVITKIGDIENLQVSAKVPERYVSELKIGQKAEISLEGYADVVFPASVVRVSPVVDAATRTKEIILNFDEKDSRVNAGMFAKVKLYTTEYAGHIAIQQDSLVNNNDEYFLYVVNNDGNTVSKRKVTLGKNVKGYYQILDGVNVGEKVVVEGMLTLADGGKIKDITNGVPVEVPQNDEQKQMPAPDHK